jgi:hypothetical protein
MFDLFWNDKDGSLKFEYYEDKVFAHAQAYNWNKSIYLKFKDIWHVAKEELLEAGFKEIYVAVPADNEKLVKFETMFGFKEVKKHNNILIMVCSTEK